MNYNCVEFALCRNTCPYFECKLESLPAAEIHTDTFDDIGDPFPCFLQRTLDQDAPHLVRDFEEGVVRQTEDEKCYDHLCIRGSLLSNLLPKGRRDRFLHARSHDERLHMETGLGFRKALSVCSTSCSMVSATSTPCKCSVAGREDNLCSPFLTFPFPRQDNVSQLSRKAEQFTEAWRCDPSLKTSVSSVATAGLSSASRTGFSSATCQGRPLPLRGSSFSPLHSVWPHSPERKGRPAVLSLESTRQNIVCGASSPLPILVVTEKNDAATDGLIPHYESSSPTWPIERVLFCESGLEEASSSVPPLQSDNPVIDNNTILIEMSCERVSSPGTDSHRSFGCSDHDRDEPSLLALEGVLTASHSHPGFPRLDHWLLGDVAEAIRKRYYGRLTAAERRNEELLFFLAWSEQREEAKVRLLRQFQASTPSTKTSSHKKGLNQGEGPTFLSMYSMSFVFPDPALSRESLKNVKKCFFHEIYLRAYALQEFASPILSSVRNEDGFSTLDDASSRGLEWPSSTFVVYIASPLLPIVGVDFPNSSVSLPLREGFSHGSEEPSSTRCSTSIFSTLRSSPLASSLTPNASASDFIEWISRQVDLYEDLVFPLSLS